MFLFVLFSSSTETVSKHERPANTARCEVILTGIVKHVLERTNTGEAGISNAGKMLPTHGRTVYCENYALDSLI